MVQTYQSVTTGVGASARTPRLVYRLTWLTVLLLFAISALMLTHFDVHYEAEGGTPLEKIHPAHFMTWATLLLLVVTSDRPLVFVDGLLMRHKGTVFFLLTWVMLLFQIAVVQRKPFTPIIDTFLLPVALFYLLTSIDRRDYRGLGRLVHVLMLANALLGLLEVMTGWRLTPLVVNGLVLSDDWRATALLGHPLANASLTGTYLVILALGGSRDLPWIARPLLFATNFAAMNAFGGRAALVLLVPFLFVIFAIRSVHTLHGGKTLRRNWILAAVLIPVAITAIVAGYQFGLFDRFADRFVDDRGSASARLIMLEIFRDLSWREIIMGPDPEHVASLLRMQGLNFGIESFWVAFVLSYGLFVSLFFFAGLAAFLFDVVKVAGARAIAPLLYFFLVASTFVSLSAKSTDLGIVVVMLVVLLTSWEVSAIKRRRLPGNGR